MSAATKTMALRQLDQTLAELSALRRVQKPKTGWIKTIRKTIGMSAAQLAKRLGVSQPAVSKIEHNEADGKVTLATLEKTAAALDCTLVYALVPNSSLSEFVEQKAKEKAAQRMIGISHSMALEAQSVSDEQTANQIDVLANEILRSWPRSLWADDVD